MRHRPFKRDRQSVRRFKMLYNGPLAFARRLRLLGLAGDVTVGEAYAGSR